MLFFIFFKFLGYLLSLSYYYLCRQKYTDYERKTTDNDSYCSNGEPHNIGG